ncbi:MAG: DUF4292 domain-containing protein [Chitinophagaceae bacterium]
MNFSKILGFSAIIFLAACHSTKKVASTTPTVVKKDTTATAAVKDSATIAKEVWLNWQNSAPNYHTLSGKLGVSIKMANLDQTVNANLRSTKDSLVWLSLTGPFNIEGARAKITPDSAIVINKLNNTVEKRSIDYLRHLVHQPLSFVDVQNILTGRMLLQNGTMQSFKGSVDGTWSFVLQEGTTQNIVTIDPSSNRLLQNRLTDLSHPSKNCVVQYKDFQQTASGWIPGEIHITANDQSSIEIELKYKQLNFNQTLDYPFNISAKYRVKE